MGRGTGSQAELEWRRMTAANMFEAGFDDDADVAAAVRAHVKTVGRWRRAFAARGREGLASRKHAGRPPRLTGGQLRRLDELLVATPQSCGFAGRYLWTQQLVADLIGREFGVSYHHDHVGVILGRLGFTHQKPARRARERDEARIEGWRKASWPDLLKKTPTPAAG